MGRTEEETGQTQKRTKRRKELAGSDAASAAENGSAARQDETAADENVFGDQLTR